MQLYTKAFHQDSLIVPGEVVWSWFDIIILDNADSTTPKVKNGVTLAAKSHSIAFEDNEPTFREGRVFGRESVFLGMIEVRRVLPNMSRLFSDVHCSRSEMLLRSEPALSFLGGQTMRTKLSSSFGLTTKVRTVYRFTTHHLVNTSSGSFIEKKTVPKLPNLAFLAAQNLIVKSKIEEAYDQAGTSGESFRSETTSLLQREFRLDGNLVASKDPPLRLLSIGKLVYVFSGALAADILNRWGWYSGSFSTA